MKARDGENTIRQEDIELLFDNEGDKIALIMLGGVNYYTGQAFDFKSITKLAHDHSCFVGFDLAHAAGNLELDLHDTGVDLCSLVYL